MTTPPTPTEQSTVQKKRSPLFLFVLGGIIIVLLAAPALVYGRRHHDVVTRMIVRVMPLPAAVVRGRVVWLSDIFSETQGYLSWEKKIVAADPGTPLHTWEETAGNVLARHVMMAKLRAIAAERGIVVTNAEITAEYATRTEEEDRLRKDLGWSEKEFQQDVVGVYLLEQKLQGTLGVETLARELENNDGVIRLWGVE